MNSTYTPRRVSPRCDAAPHPQLPSRTTPPEQPTQFLKSQQLRSRSRKGAGRRQSKLSKKQQQQQQHTGSASPPTTLTWTSITIVNTLAQLQQLHDDVLHNNDDDNGNGSSTKPTHDVPHLETPCAAPLDQDGMITPDAPPPPLHQSHQPHHHPPRPWHRAIAIDCEWQPFDTRDTKTPVSLLQLATDDGRVWLVDLLALLCPLPSLLGAPGALEGGDGLCWTRDATEEEEVLGSLLYGLCVRDDIIKVGGIGGCWGVCVCVCVGGGCWRA